jgi:hypothetical protein
MSGGWFGVTLCWLTKHVQSDALATVDGSNSTLGSSTATFPKVVPNVHVIRNHALVSSRHPNLTVLGNVETSNIRVQI